MSGPQRALAAVPPRRRTLRSLVLCATALALVACETPQPRAPQPVPRQPVPEMPPAPPATPQPPPAKLPEPGAAARPARPPARAHRLGTATNALVVQARQQSAAGRHAAAASILERAIRIEPGNPLVWIELGKVRQAEGRHDQAQSVGEKALSMAAGDVSVQASAWRLIASAQRARGRMLQARESERRAQTLSPR